MKRGACLLVILLLSADAIRADDNSISLPDLISGAQQWAQQNLDTNVLNSLPPMDDQAVQNFLRQLQAQYQGDYVVDLASLRQTAQAALPLLESSADTQPYAAWLKAQMPYLKVADEIRISIPPPATTLPPSPPVTSPPTVTNQAPALIPKPPPKIAANPPPQQEREIWVQEVSSEPWPANAKKYVAELKPVFAAQNVPPELVWLAEVESSFDRRAESPAGAAGLFQLMPDTARRFGLSLWPRDQRFQPEPSATASAQYLKYLYGHFHDWRLVLAAYNAGEGRVQRLLDRYQTRSYDRIAAHLPAETQMYVPRIEAVLLQREGAKLEELGRS
jgi:membrane-bound lytic murein transglycosylase D